MVNNLWLQPGVVYTFYQAAVAMTTIFDAETDNLKTELKRERAINQWLRTKSAAREKLTNITLTHVAITIGIFVIPAMLIDLGLL